MLDKITAPWDIKESPFYTNPEAFLKLGQKVRAKVRVYDLPGNPDPGMIHAEVGETGTVIHVEKGFWPTVQFDRTHTRTDVTDFEVEPFWKCEACMDTGFAQGKPSSMVDDGCANPQCPIR